MSPHLAYCGGSFGRVSLMAADTALADHARDCVQLLVNVHSAVRAVRVDGATVGLQPFEAVVIAPRQTYAIPPQGGGPVAHASAPGFLLVKSPVAGGASGRGVRGGLVRTALRGAARDDTRQLVAELLRPAPASATIEGGVRALQVAGGAPPDAAQARGPGGRTLARIAREIEALQGLQDFGSTRERAAACAMSERHFLTLFRRATQLPPRGFYNMLRLETAFAQLADAGCGSVADIAYRLGFSAPPHFTRFMRANTGWTPTAYRACLQALPPPLRPRLAVQAAR